jgi:uncharacterized protein
MNAEMNEIAARVIPVLRQSGIRRSALFGSVVRGETTPNSDIDILVELPRGQSLLDLVALGRKLRRAVGREIDVVEYGGLNPLLRDRILLEQVSLL